MWNVEGMETHSVDDKCPNYQLLNAFSLALIKNSHKKDSSEFFSKTNFLFNAK